MSPDPSPPAASGPLPNPPPAESAPHAAAPPDVDTTLPLFTRREHRGEADLDITPMIDVTFLLLIFFLVASVPDVEYAVDLPTARYGTTVSARASTIITIAEGPGAAAQVFLADGARGTPLPEDPAEREKQIVAAIEEGLREGRPHVLIKAARGVRHRVVSRVAEAAGYVEGIDLHLAVLETD